MPILHSSLVYGFRAEVPQQEQDLLQQALADEMAKAARRSGQDAGNGSQVQFKQVEPTSHSCTQSALLSVN